MKSHSFGVVINSNPGGLNSNYIKAHRPSCSSFRRHVGAMTVYSKHCFDSASEALEYLQGRGVSRPTFGCKSCAVAELEPTANEQELQERSANLIAKGFLSPPQGNRAPSKISSNTTMLIQRDPAVVAWVQREAAGRCELCSVDAPFQTDKGRPYLEVHHVITLASGGPDTVDNTVALCPNCHRAMHYAVDKSLLIKKIYMRVARLVRAEQSNV